MSILDIPRAFFACVGMAIDIGIQMRRSTRTQAAVLNDLSDIEAGVEPGVEYRKWPNPPGVGMPARDGSNFTIGKTVLHPISPFDRTTEPSAEFTLVRLATDTEPAEYDLHLTLREGESNPYPTDSPDAVAASLPGDPSTAIPPAVDTAPAVSPQAAGAPTSWIEFATPLIAGVLADHRPVGGTFVEGTAGKIHCIAFTQRHELFQDWQSWRLHVAKMIAAALESACLATFPNTP